MHILGLMHYRPFLCSSKVSDLILGLQFSVFFILTSQVHGKLQRELCETLQYIGNSKYLKFCMNFQTENKTSRQTTQCFGRNENWPCCKSKSAPNIKIIPYLKQEQRNAMSDKAKLQPGLLCSIATRSRGSSASSSSVNRSMGFSSPVRFCPRKRCLFCPCFKDYCNPAV